MLVFPDLSIAVKEIFPLYCFDWSAVRVNFAVAVFLSAVIVIFSRLIVPPSLFRFLVVLEPFSLVYVHVILSTPEMSSTAVKVTVTSF